MSRKSPLRDREAAIAYVRDYVRGWAAENLDDGAAALSGDALDAVTARAMATWDERMADPARVIPADGVPNRRKELDYAISGAIGQELLPGPELPPGPRPRVSPPGVNSVLAVDAAVAAARLRDAARFGGYLEALPDGQLADRGQRKPGHPGHSWPATAAPPLPRGGDHGSPGQETGTPEGNPR